MSEVRFFMRPESLFALVGDLATQYQMIVTFRRFESPRGPAGFRVVAAGDELARIYHDGGYSEFLLSVSAKPRHEQDWEFPSSVAEQILEFTGGRVAGKEVEECVARPLAKQTEVSRQFEALRRRLDAVCDRGVVEPKTDTRYAKVYWERELSGLGFVLRPSLDNPAVEFRPIPHPEPSRTKKRKEPE
jgi:hypothetical protein